MAVELTSLQRLWNMARALRPSPPRRALNAMAFCPSTARAPVCAPKQSQRVHKRRSLKLRGVRDAKAIEVSLLHSFLLVGRVSCRQCVPGHNGFVPVHYPVKLARFAHAKLNMRAAILISFVCLPPSCAVLQVVELHHAFSWATGAEQSGSLTRSLSSRPSLGGLCVLPAEC